MSLPPWKVSWSGGLRSLHTVGTHDFLVLSAHGAIGKGDADFIQLPGKQRLRPNDLARIAGRLVYLDSFDLGISASFLNALRTDHVEFLARANPKQ